MNCSHDRRLQLFRLCGDLYNSEETDHCTGRLNRGKEWGENGHNTAAREKTVLYRVSGLLPFFQIPTVILIMNTSACILCTKSCRFTGFSLYSIWLFINFFIAMMKTKTKKKILLHKTILKYKWSNKDDKEWWNPKGKLKTPPDYTTFWQTVIDVYFGNHVTYNVPFKYVCFGYCLLSKKLHHDWFHLFHNTQNTLIKWDCY